MDFYRHAVSFPGLGIGEFEINQTAFTIPGIDWPIRWYGVIIAAGFLLAILYILKRTRTFGLDADRVLDVIIGAVIGGIVGARLYYVIFSWEIYADDPISVFYLWKGGIAIYGGVIGGFLVGYLICRWRKVKFLPMADLAVGRAHPRAVDRRWGNFVNIEAFGSNTTAPWGMAGPAVRQYLASHQAALAAQGVVVDPSLPVHPTFFYESAWCLLGFLFIAWYTKRRRFDGRAGPRLCRVVRRGPRRHRGPPDRQPHVGERPGVAGRSRSSLWSPRWRSRSGCAGASARTRGIPII